MYEVLVLRHQSKVFNVLYRFFGNYEASQDISQETFLTAYRKLGMFSGRSAFSSWLCQIALNKARDLLRTLRAWVACGGSTVRTAKAVPCHRNTVINRLRRVAQLTGRSLADDAPPVELDLALRALATRSIR